MQIPLYMRWHSRNQSQMNRIHPYTWNGCRHIYEGVTKRQTLEIPTDVGASTELEWERRIIPSLSRSVRSQWIWPQNYILCNSILTINMHDAWGKIRGFWQVTFWGNKISDYTRLIANYQLWLGLPWSLWFPDVVNTWPATHLLACSTLSQSKLLYSNPPLSSVLTCWFWVVNLPYHLPLEWLVYALVNCYKTLSHRQAGNESSGYNIRKNLTS